MKEDRYVSEKEIQAAIKALAEKRNWIYVAKLLGESSTGNLQRWITPSGRVPKSRKILIARQLRAEGVLK